jgi:hypothetical protein
VKTLRDDYKLTLNGPYPIDNFLGIHFSHQDNGELHMSQTGLIDAVTEIAQFSKVNSKIHQHQLHQSYTLTQKDLRDKNPGTIYPLSDNSNILHRILGQTYHSQFTNAHGSLRNRRLYTKKQSNA